MARKLPYSVHREISDHSSLRVSLGMSTLWALFE